MKGIACTLAVFLVICPSLLLATTNPPQTTQDPVMVCANALTSCSSTFQTDYSSAQTDAAKCTAADTFVSCVGTGCPNTTLLASNWNATVQTALSNVNCSFATRITSAPVLLLLIATLTLLLSAIL